MKICFLVHHKVPLSQATNTYILANAVIALHHQVSFSFADSLTYLNGEAHARIVPVKTLLTEDITFEDMRFADGALSGFDILWVLSFGTRQTFLDKMQLLKLLPETVRTVNSLDALFFLHSKTSQLKLDGLMQYPETHISCNADALWHIVQKSQAEWIVKPVAESLGRDVFRLKPGDSNTRALLQNMTGYENTRYCLLQRYVPEVTAGEKRVLVAGGEVIGQYLRKPSGSDHRGNLHQGAEAILCDLTPEEKEAYGCVAGWLLKRGVYFAGLDIAWPWLLEWNVVNPGGIATIDKLGGGNLAEIVVGKVLNHH